MIKLPVTFVDDPRFIGGKRVVVSSPDWGPSLTKQADAKDADVNTIIKRFVKAGGVSGGALLPPNLSGKSPMFADVSQVPDYKSALDLVRNSNARFDSLPSAIKARFPTPEAFYQFVTDGKNLPELVKLGLAKYAPGMAPKAPEAPPAPQGAAGAGGAPPVSPKAS